MNVNSMTGHGTNGRGINGTRYEWARYDWTRYKFRTSIFCVEWSGYAVTKLIFLKKYRYLLLRLDIQTDIFQDWFKSFIITYRYTVHYYLALIWPNSRRVHNTFREKVFEKKFGVSLCPLIYIFISHMRVFQRTRRGIREPFHERSCFSGLCSGPN